MTAIVSTDWLAARLNRSDICVLDGSWYLPSAQRSPIGEFSASHIPGAQFFDLSQICDKKSKYPNMLPSAKAFTAAVRALGINNDSLVVVYDGAGMFSSPRVWWMFRAMGHHNVFVLNGGLPKWTNETRPVTNDTPSRTGGQFRANLCRALIADWQRALTASAHKETQILDARAPERFKGLSPEPRKGVRAGHIPGAINIPHTELKTEEGILKSPADLEQVFTSAGIDLAAPIITSCGSGVTASVLALALYQIGVPEVALYDGSWAEWGARVDLKLETQIA